MHVRICHSQVRDVGCLLRYLSMNCLDPGRYWCLVAADEAGVFLKLEDHVRSEINMRLVEFVHREIPRTPIQRRPDKQRLSVA